MTVSTESTPPVPAPVLDSSEAVEKLGDSDEFENHDSGVSSVRKE